MRSDIIINEYIGKVTDLIKWKRAKSPVSAELNAHICDQRDIHVLDGMDEQEATELAIVALGEPDSVAALLNESHKPKRQFVITFIVVWLFVCGIILRLVMAINLNKTFSVGDYVAIGMALAAFAGGWMFNITYIKKFPRQIFIGFIALFAVLLLFSTSINGKRTFSIFDDRLNLDLVSLLFPISFVGLMFALRDKKYPGIILCGAGYVASIVLVSLVPSIAGFVLITVSAVIMVCVAVCMQWFGVEKIKGKLLVFASALVSIGVFGVHAWTDPQLHRRIELLINPVADAHGAGYQSMLVRALIGSSQFWGGGAVSPALSEAPGFVEKFNGEYLLTYYIYNNGFVVFAEMMILLAVLLTVSIVLCVKQKNYIGKMTSLAVIVSIGIQAIVYTANNFGFNIGAAMSLPFLSNDNTALVINMLLAGLMISAFRHERVLRDIETDVDKRQPLFCYDESGMRIVNPKRK